ncbi:MAG: protein translocase subunit SecF [bacterium]
MLLVCAWAFFFSNARFSEEFTGGVKITVAGNLSEESLKQDLQSYLTSQGYLNTNIAAQQEKNTTKISLRTDVQNDEKVNVLSKDIQKFLVDKKYISSTSMILEQSITGPSVGGYMQKTARNAIIVGVILMAIYMMFSFATIRKSIAPGVLALVTVVTMIFDVSLPAGAYGIWMMLDKTVMIDSVFIVALLTNMGYSINDTIIIFDRIRENVQNKSSQKGILFGKIFEDSLWQTMRRSMGTVLATFLVILAMFVLGAGVIKQFAFTIGMGVIFGSYSSIFISAPLAYILVGKYKKERKQMLELKTKDL